MTVGSVTRRQPSHNTDGKYATSWHSCRSWVGESMAPVDLPRRHGDRSQPKASSERCDHAVAREASWNRVRVIRLVLERTVGNYLNRRQTSVNS